LVLFSAAVLVGGAVGDDLVALNDEMRSNLRLYTELIEVAHQRYGSEVSYKELVYASIDGMLRSLDPHTNFLSREAYDSMREKQQGSFYGLGIFVGMRNGQLTVITPIPGTPAHQKGMRAGDVISAIDGHLTATLSVDEAISRLKGPKDTQVTVTIVRPGLEEPLDLEITRAEIPQNTVQFAYMITPDTGYLSIRDFSRSTGAEVARSLHDLKSKGMQRLILDLRGNGGGLLDQAIEVADQFVPEGSKIVETRGRIRSSFSEFSSSGTYQELDLPLVVLVDGGSASAAEILAGAIQDHDVGLIVGEPTWGKGLVQTVYTLPHGNGLAVTTARYYTPSGRLIQRDYSSYWDYYTRYDDSVTAEDLELRAAEAKEVFHTDLGRNVFGGGGIVPDVHVEPDDLHPLLQKILARSALFTFAIELQQREAIDGPSWSPSDATLHELGAWLVAEEYAAEDEVREAFTDPKVIEFVRHRLRNELFNGLFGLDEGHRTTLAIDHQLQTAFEQFDKALELLERRQAMAPPETDPKGVAEPTQRTEVGSAAQGV
jgi:carboxyl-terminal processing protease